MQLLLHPPRVLHLFHVYADEHVPSEAQDADVLHLQGLAELQFQLEEPNTPALAGVGPEYPEEAQLQVLVVRILSKLIELFVKNC